MNSEATEFFAGVSSWEINANLGSTIGGVAGDAAADTVTVNGTVTGSNSNISDTADAVVTLLCGKSSVGHAV